MKKVKRQYKRPTLKAMPLFKDLLAVRGISI
ncbi:hypothetical protein CLORY_45050 [Clostridium oryzae]|uniref:Uncharacterized protein n=1 Tax=Clostridium oryzae TaxID=1450648 RepID=A0A1V4I4F6_9CLOT|nr:hypothetical protein CLORY_45050 [Clostridium oryzae]